MKHTCTPPISPLLLLLTLGIFGAREVSGQISNQSSASATVSDQADSMAEPMGYWIFLDGKRDAPPVEISDRARARRARRGQPHTAELDQNVPPTYIRKLEELGVQIRVESRWLNAVSAELTEELLAQVRELGFVREVRALARRTNTFPEPVEAAPLSKTAGDIYGNSRTQLALMNAIAPLERGINGQGVRIGFLDTPFSEFNHSAFDPLKADNRLIAIKNFTGKTDDTGTHGMNVASTAVGYQEGELIGPAHGAEVLAGITEYSPSETNQEEDNLVAGLEWMESEGADVVNISLGYAEFDTGQNSYTVSDLDGDTGITTIAVDQAVALGVVVVTSAGNSGCSSPANCWYYITMPGDADFAITVGAVASDLSRASFSSYGPTADGRIKPDVSAMGVSVYLARPGDRFGFANGTSFSSPLTAAVVAQMLQVNPDLAPMDVRDILRSTAHQSTAPDNSLGWGIINADEAIKMVESMTPTGPTTPTTPTGPQYYSPANLVASLSNDGASIRVDWTRSNSEHIERTDHFLTWVRSGHVSPDNYILGPDTLITQVDKSENGTTITGLPVGVPYTFFVRSVYEDGERGSASRVALPALTTSGSTDTTSVSTQAEEIPESVRLEQNYPNPFNPATTIRYALPKAGDVRLVVYDLLGHEVDVLIDGPRAAGLHTVRFDANHLPNGAYVYRLAAGNKTITRTMVLLK